MSFNSTGLIVGIIVASLLVIGSGAAMSLYFGRKAKTSEAWLSASESLPLVVVVITQFAAAAGGGVLIAHVGIAYGSGWSVFAYEACVVAGFLLLMLIARWLREQKFTTVPDVITRLFGQNKFVTAIAALAALIVPFGWVATQFVAFAQLFGQLTGIAYPILILVVTAASLIFVLPGGLTSIAWADFMFGIVKIVLAIVVAAFAVHLAGGWEHITQTVPERIWSVESITAVGWPQIWLWAAAIIPGTLTNQLYYQRVFATKKIKDARLGLGLSGATMLLSGLYAGCIGIAVQAMKPSLANKEEAAGWLLTQLPDWMLIVFAAFLVATIVATSGAALQSVTTSVVRDIYQNVAGKRTGDTRTVAFSRIVTVVVAIIAASLAIAFPSALAWLVATYAYSAAALTAPIFLGYLLHRRQKLTPAMAITSIIVGIIGCAIAQVLATPVPYAVYGVATSTLTLLTLAFLGSRKTTPAPEPEEEKELEKVT